jgi:predicted MFS family arabinose efflux permease
MIKSQQIAWLMWMAGAIFYAYQYILRVMPNIMMLDVMDKFHMDAITFGQFSGIYYIGYSVMHLPIGIMLDHYGPRKIMPLCILLTIVGTLPIIFAENAIYPIIGRFLVGVGSSAAILGTFKIIRLGFEEAKFTRMLSIAVSIGLVGAIYGGGPVNYMNEVYGYVSVITIIAAAGVVLALVTYFLVPDIKAKASASIFGDVVEVISNSKVMTICILAGFMVGPMEGFADVWGTQFLKQTYGLDGPVAASLPSMIFIGMCFGGPALSFVAEKTGYFTAIIIAGIVMTTSFVLLLASEISVATITFVFAIVGVCCAYQIIAIYKASTYVREGLVGLTTALANMIIMIFGYFFHSSIGWVINAFNKEPDIAFTYGIAVIPACLLIGVIGFSYLAMKK